jgi:hypothetical protein
MAAEVFGVTGGGAAAHQRMLNALRLRFSETDLPLLAGLHLASGTDAYVVNLTIPRDLLGRGAYGRSFKQYELFHSWTIAMMDLAGWTRSRARRRTEGTARSWFVEAWSKIEEASELIGEVEGMLAEIKENHWREWSVKNRGEAERMDRERAAMRDEMGQSEEPQTGDIIF